jgi:acyl-coenzyme A thioesterase PaaI-like protein
MPPGHAVLSVELKTNLLSPARGDRLVAIGRVVRAGRTLTVCLGEGWMEREDGREQVALMTATMIGLPDRE